MGGCIYSAKSANDDHQPLKSSSSIDDNTSNNQKKMPNIDKLQSMLDNFIPKKSYRQLQREKEREFDIKNNNNQNQLFQQSLGLPNLKNTCFLNSLLQFLFAAEELRLTIMSKKEKKFELKEILCNIFTSILSTEQKQIYAKTASITQLIQYLKKQKVDYESSSQQDSLQFLMLILNKFEEQDQQYLKLFQVQYQQICLKRGCGQRSSLRQYYLPNNFKRCPTCKSQCEIKLINKAEYIVILNLNDQKKEQRFQMKTKNNQIFVYQLKAQILYTGTNRAGHYIAKRKKINAGQNQKDRFFYFNDEKLQKIIQKFLGFSAVASLYEIQLQQPEQKKKSNEKKTKQAQKRLSTIQSPRKLQIKSPLKQQQQKQRKLKIQEQEKLKRQRVQRVQKDRQESQKKRRIIQKNRLKQQQDKNNKKHKYQQKRLAQIQLKIKQETHDNSRAIRQKNKGRQIIRQGQIYETTFIGRPLQNASKQIKFIFQIKNRKLKWLNQPGRQFHKSNQIVFIQFVNLPENVSKLIHQIWQQDYIKTSQNDPQKYHNGKQGF